MEINPLLFVRAGKPLPVEEKWRCKRSGDCCTHGTSLTMTEQERVALYELAEKRLTVGELSVMRWRPGADPGFVELQTGPCPLFKKVDGVPTCTVHEARPYNCRRFGCMRPDPRNEPFQSAPHSPVLQYGNVGCSNLRLRLVQSPKVRKQYDRLQKKGRTWAVNHGWKG